MSVVGIDQSATGTAMVRLDEVAHLVDQRFYADTKGDARRWEQFGALEPVKVRAGDLRSQTYRLDQLDSQLQDFLIDSSGKVPVVRDTHAALEDYALARKAFSHALGEIGGTVKLRLWNERIPFRAYDPQAVKIFVTGKGNADKTQMIDGVKRKWGEDWRQYGRKDDGSAGNLADAFAIAMMLWTELQVRAGEIDLRDLPEEERRVFLRATKQNPVNLLDLPFVLADE